MITIQKPTKIFKCNKCLGEFILGVIKDSRNYKPYYYACPYCGTDIDSGLC